MKISTFTLVAREPESGNIAVAGGTNWFCYGRWVPHIEAGCGALATQAETNMWYAPNGIENLKKGMSAQDTLKDLLKREADPDGVYQLLIIDNDGNTAGYTGVDNHHFAGHKTFKNFAVAGNTLVSEETLRAMVDFWNKNDLPFGEKIIKTLQAGQAAGGDIRGMKSAALKIAKGDSTGKYWNDIIYDIRVDESANPLQELERLYTVAEAYTYIGDAESAGTPSEALLLYQKALELDPNNEEIKFWIARMYAKLEQHDKAKILMDELKNGTGHWQEFWNRIESK